MTSMRCAAALAACLLAAHPALAHGPAAHGPQRAAPHQEQQAWGIAGEAAQVRRTIEVRMSDAMRFQPDRLRIRLGETVRFVVRNRGRMRHEFVIGTTEALDAHAALMQKHPDMEHDEPHMAHVEPAGAGEVVWTFNRPGSFAFACLIAGHYQAGMVGRIEVAP